MDPVIITSLASEVTRLGVVLEPNGDASEVEGILNPAAVRARNGKLLLYPRMVAAGNCSRIGLVEVGGSHEEPMYERIGVALHPQASYERRPAGDGQGCEDPRVTFVPVLDAFVMAYTALGTAGPRIALALSPDGYAWERLGLMHFSAPELPRGSDKDAAFFPEPVRSPNGVMSLAMYHRPMHVAARLAPSAHRASPEPALPAGPEVTRIAYIPLEPVLANRRNLLNVAESVVVCETLGTWGLIKNGAGTPPVRIEEGWLSVFHGVDRASAEHGGAGLRYSAGILVHDADEPHRLRYRSPEPILTADIPAEQRGIVNNVVFPTGIDVHDRLPRRTWDVYYGMADARVGRIRLTLGSSVSAASVRDDAQGEAA